MSVDVTKIHQGTGRVWRGITAAATGTPPTLQTHTAGVPSTGTEIGYTDGDLEFSFVLTHSEVKAEQSLGVVGVFAVEEAVSLKFTMQEANYSAWTLAMGGVGTVTDGSKYLWYGGDGTGVLAPTTQSFQFTSLQPQAPTKFFVGTIYKGYIVPGFKTVFSKTNRSLVQVEIRGIEDSSRNAGDRMFQFYREL